MKVRKLFLLFFGITLSYFCQAQLVDKVPAGTYHKLIGLIRSDSIAKADSLNNYYFTIDTAVYDLYLVKAAIIERAYTDSAKKQSISLNKSYKYSDDIPYRHNPLINTYVKYPAAIYAQIEKNLLKASQLSPQILIADFELVKLYSQQLEANKLKPIFEKIRTKRDESYIGLQFSNQIANFFKQNKFNDGVNVYHALMEVYPNRPRLKEELALQYFYHNNIDMAYRLCNELYADGNNTYATIDLLITLNQYLGNYDEAIKLIYNSNNNAYLFQLALMEIKTKPEKWKNTLHSYLQIGIDETALKIAQQMAADTFAFTPKYYNILLSHKPDKETKLLLANVFNHPQAQLDYVKLLIPVDLTDNALQKLEEIEKPKKLSAELRSYYYLSLGWCYNASDDTKDAIKAWKKAADINLRNDQTLWANKLLAEYYTRIGKTKKAEEYISKTKELGPGRD